MPGLLPTNAYITNPFGGVLSLFTASFYKLNRTRSQPVEPIADIIPAVTGKRVAMDMVDSETYTQNYAVTRNTIQDFTDTTPNIYREPIELSITGTFTASGPLLPVGNVPTFGYRFDLLRLAQLNRMAAERQPIMVVTPRVSLAQAFIQSITHPWTPNEAQSTVVTVNLIECRILRPIDAEALADTVNMAAGNVSKTSAGTQGQGASELLPAVPAEVPQVPPAINVQAAGTVGF